MDHLSQYAPLIPMALFLLYVLYLLKDNQKRIDDLEFRDYLHHDLTHRIEPLPPVGELDAEERQD